MLRYRLNVASGSNGQKATFFYVFVVYNRPHDAKRGIFSNS